jgi:hypothetical protein
MGDITLIINIYNFTNNYNPIQMNFQKIASFCSTLDQFGATYIPAIKKD